MSDEKMTFKVRSGFALHVARVLDLSDGVKSPTIDHFGARFGREVAELTGAEATRHLHALEPTDEVSRAWLEARVSRPQPAPEPPPTRIDPALVELLATSIARALALVKRA